MAAFLSFDEFSGVLSHSAGMLVVVLTGACDDVGLREAAAVEAVVGHSAAVHLLCAPVPSSPTVVFYEGGDSRPLLTLSAPTDAQVRDALTEAARAAAVRLSAADEAAQREATVAQTAHMLESEKLDQFPSFFRMARNLAKDAWYAAKQTAEGAPLLLASEVAAARLAVCVTCPSFRDKRCVECGCYMTVKAHIAAMSCPLDKWPA